MPRDVEAGPASRRPSPSRRLQGQVVLALASACVFSVAVIGRTHPLERTDRRGFLHLRTKYWRDGRFRLSEAGIRSIVAAVEAHRNPATAWPLWFAVAVLAVGAFAALSFIRRSEDPHSHLK